MSLHLEEVKILPSILQDIIDEGQNVFVKCDVTVPNNMLDHKTFKIHMPSCQLKLSIPNLSKFYKTNDPRVLGGLKKNTSKMSTTFNCWLNFPINKIVRGIHPSSLQSFDNPPPSHTDNNHYGWAEQLESWISLYDAEVSSYYDINCGDDMPDEILKCNNTATRDMVMVEFKRIYGEANGSTHVEYLYYLTYADSYDESFLKDALLEYHELFNMPAPPNSKTCNLPVYSSHVIKSNK